MKIKKGLLQFFYCLEFVLYGWWVGYWFMLDKQILLNLSRERAKQLDILVKKGLYPSRNEAIRTAINELIEFHSTHKCREFKMVPYFAKDLKHI